LAIGTDPAPVCTDTDGFVRQFQGPDGIQTLWVDFGGTRRFLKGREVGTSSDAALTTAAGLDSASANLVNTSSSTRAALDGRYAGTAAANVFTATQTVPSLELQYSTTTPTLITGTQATGGATRVSVQPLNISSSTAPAQIELVPGALNDSSTSIASQLLLMNKTGNNYERFTLTCQGNQFLIESTYNGTGTARDILFQSGGSVSNSIAGQTSLVVYADASVDLQGGSYVAFGKTWGTNRTRVADPGNSGDSRLVLDTRTKTPADNAADSSSMEFRRGGTVKWHVGLNYAGANADNFDFYSQQGAGLALTLGGGATAKIGFLGKAPAARAATPVTLADVIAVLQTFGLVT
jgi:hypothetical protein